ncbi:OmpA family protein [Geodermatophilus nigrescens]
MRDPRKRSPLHRVAAVAVLAVLACLALIGCEQPEQDCSDLLGLRPGDGPAVVLVVDRTASAPRFLLPDAVAATVREAAGSNGRVSVLAVDGPGAAPRWVLQDAALNEAGLDADTDRFERIASLAVGCVEDAVATTAPSVPDSDVLTALQRAADSVAAVPSARIALLSDGLANAGPLDLDQVAVADAPVDAVVDALADGGQLPRFTGQQLTLHGIGQTSGEPLAQPVREWLRELWSAVCLRSGATGCSAEPGDVPVDAASPAPVPDAAVAVPGIQAVAVGGTCTWTVDSALLFDGDSAALRPGAAEALAPVAAALRAPGATADVVGHTSSFGSLAGQQSTSEQRADAVAGLLVDLAVPADRLRPRGAGATELRVPDRDAAGQLVEAAAAQNRRVEVAVTGASGCGR